MSTALKAVSTRQSFSLCAKHSVIVRTQDPQSDMSGRDLSELQFLSLLKQDNTSVYLGSVLRSHGRKCREWMVPGCHGCQLLNGPLPKFLPVAMAILKSHQACTLKVWQLVSSEEEEGLERQVKWPWYKDKTHPSTQLLAISPPVSQTAHFHAGSVEFERFMEGEGGSVGSGHEGGGPAWQ